MIIQIILHPGHEPALHTETFYQGNTKMYRGIAEKFKPYSNNGKIKHITLPANECRIYWLFSWPLLNQVFNRSMVIAWNRLKDQQPKQLRKRQWPNGTRFYFARSLAIPHEENGQEFINYQIPNAGKYFTLNHTKRQWLTKDGYWHCVERVNNGLICLQEYNKMLNC